VGDWLGDARRRLAAEAALRDEELELAAEEIELLLRAAGVAAHASGDRKNAPLLCYLLGLARGKSDVAVATLIEAATASSTRSVP
jgi:hypothetical protein